MGGSGPHGARAAVAVGGVPVRIETTETTRNRMLDERFGRMVGRSPAMQVVFDLLNEFVDAAEKFNARIAG